MIRLYDSAAGEVRDLRLRTPGAVSMYVCGPTVYGYPHLGHGRFSLVWDVARRWLTFLGLEVDYVSNITDIDDKIINLARTQGITEAEVAAHWEAEWWRAMGLIGVAKPTHSPHATEFVSGMVSLISSLLARDVAYLTSDGVYFDVSMVPDYGLLGGQSLDSLRAGARVEANEEKRSPLDFALWKAAKPGEPSWPTPFGEGRPGWHTECVVMSLGLLGDGFDLHCGGLDLKFPHHENERAQAVALGQAFARHWAHNGFVMVGEEKMSKSLNNFTSLTDLLEQTDQRAYRLLVLRSHYRSPIDVSPVTIADAERALERLDALARRFDLAPHDANDFATKSDPYATDAANALVTAVSNDMADDLNTPLALAKIFEAVSSANALADAGHTDEAATLATAVRDLLAAMGLSVSGASDEVGDEAASLVAARDAARAAKDWTRADQLRDYLVALGWIVEDSAAGTLIRRG